MANVEQAVVDDWTSGFSRVSSKSGVSSLRASGLIFGIF